MKKSLLLLMAAAAVSAYAQDAQVLTADVENLYLWNYTTTAWKDYQVNEQSFSVTAENLTENITWVMESSGKAKGSYIGEGTTRFELLNNGLYEANSGKLGIRVTSKEPGTFEDVIVLTSGELEVRIPVTLKVAGTEGDGYWDENEFAPLSIADANLIHDVMPANTSYATDDTHKFDTYGGDNGLRFFRGTVASFIEDGTADYVLTDNSGKEVAVTLDECGISIGIGDIVTLEADLADVDGLCVLQSCTIQNVEDGEVPAAGPAVTMEPGAITSNTIELTFTPNEQTGKYYACLFGEGELESQFNMFGAWMGFTCYGDMIKAWGYDCEGVQTKTWKDLVPGTTYEIYVQSLDAAGAYGELQCFTITTTSQGGAGVSVIDIEIGEFGGDDEIGHWQQVIYTPNDQTAVFFDLICTEEFYQENGAEGVKAFLLEEADPENPNYIYYAQFSQDNAIWNAEPGTTYHACAIGKNANGEWGELADVVFTTPGSAVAIQTIEAAKAASSVRFNLHGQQTESNNGLMIQNGRVVLVK